MERTKFLFFNFSFFFTAISAHHFNRTILKHLWLKKMASEVFCLWLKVMVCQKNMHQVCTVSFNCTKFFKDISTNSFWIYLKRKLA